MGRHKCEAVAGLSSQVKCNFMNCYIVHFIFMANKFEFEFEFEYLQSTVPSQ